MKTLLKVKSTDVVLKLNFNYDNLYARIRAALKSDFDVFAKMNFLGPNISWSVIDETRRYKSLDSADSEEKTVVVANLKSLQQAIRSKLSSQKDLAPYIEVLFEVPDESFIFFSDDAEHRIVLAGWGCRMAHTANNQSGVLAMLIGNNKPAPQQQVVVKAVNQFGNPVSDRLAFDLDANHQEFTVGADGTRDFGLLPIGRHFHITDLDTDFKKEFLITEGLSTYLFQIESFEKDNNYSGDINRNASEQEREIRQGEIRQEESKTFEFTGKKDVPEQDVEIKVLSATSAPVAGQRLRIDCLQSSGVFYSDSDGIVPVGKVPVGTEIKVKVGSSDEGRTIHVESGKSTYSIICSSIRSSAPVVSLLDSSDMLVFDADIKVIKSGQETLYNSGSEGMVVLPSMKEGEHFIVVDKKRPNNSKEFVVSSDQPDGIYPFHLQIQGNGDVKVIVYDQKNRPVKDCSVALALSDGDVVEITGTDGAAVFKRHNFKGESDIPVKCTAQDGKVTCGTIHYSPDKSDYPIGISTKKPVKFPMWIFGVLGALLVLFGGYEIYKHIKPSVDMLSNGVVFIRSSYVQYANLKDKSGNVVETYYFNWNNNDFDILPNGYNFCDDLETSVITCFGTGFFVSKTGKIVTNKHVAYPDLPTLDGFIESLSTIRDAYIRLYNAGKMTESDYFTYQKIDAYVRDVNNYKVEIGQTILDVSVAYYKAIITLKDGKYGSENFHQCIIEKCGKSANEDDISIIQVKNKESIPKDVYVFHVPTRDPISEKNRGMDIRLLAYSNGIDLANGENGITPQITKGSISSFCNKYELIYDSTSLPGSSGGPILDNRGRLVGINHSGYRGEFKMGIRLIHLINLLNSEDSDNSSKN